MENPQTLTILITGTNKGLGFDLVKIFLKNHPEAIIYATSREQPTVALQKWSQIDPKRQVKCRMLQICSSQSICNLVKQFQEQNVKFDIIVNNVGMASAKDNPSQIPDLQDATSVLNTNTKGHIALTQKMLPFLTQSCKIINVSSTLGALKYHPEKTQKVFSSPKIQIHDIYEGINDYLYSVKSQKVQNWCPSAYCTSKMMLNAWSRFILQHQWLKGNQKAICVSPGFCKTPMTANSPQLQSAYSSQSGALRIYQTIFLEKLDSQVFYHRGRESDYFLCGQGLPLDISQ